MKLSAYRSVTLLGGAAVLMASTQLCDAANVSLAAAWPTTPTLETATPAQASTERDIKNNRDSAQTIQVPVAMQLDKITILVGESENLSLTADLVIFPVADVTAGTLTASGPEVLRIAAPDYSSLAIPTTKDWVPLEFDLQGAEEVTLPATAGTAGYAVQLDDTGNSQRPFKWRIAGGANVYAGGAMYTDGGSLRANDDFVLAIQEVTNDQDGDGMPDAYEDANGLDKTMNDAGLDPDGDDLDNIGEFNAGTDPQDPDSDGDTLNDGGEVSGSANAYDNAPTNPLSDDTDGDTVKDQDEIGNANGSVTNPNAADTDGEGADDAREIAENTDPNDPNDFPSGAGSYIALASEQNGEASGIGGTHLDGILFDEEVLCFTDRTHEYNGATVAGLPANLVGGDYILTANNARDNGNYVLTVTTDAECSLYLVFDSRVTPPAWMTDGVDLDFVDTGDVVGIDESGDGVGPGMGINNTSNVFIAIDKDNGDSRKFAPGVYEFFERGGSGNNMYGVVATAPIADSDGDGMPDEYEDLVGHNKLVNDAGDDPDMDGLTNLEEFNLGTDPFDEDSDGDGLTDGAEELIEFTDPLNPDSDGDGVSDGEEVGPGNGSMTDPNNPDTDGDGATDGQEIAKGTDPLNPAEFPTARYVDTVVEQNGEPEGIDGTHLNNVFYGEDVLTYTDRTHQHNGATAAGLPGSLDCGDYIMTANDARDNANYVLDITTKAACSIFVLFDSRRVGQEPAWFSDGAGIDLLNTGLTTGIDEGGDGTGPGQGINQTFEVLVAVDTTNGNAVNLPVGTYTLLERGGSGGNMYGVVVTAPIGPDDDGDGIPTWVEESYGLDSNDPAGDNGPLGDANGNMVPNALELFYGLDPAAAGPTPVLDASGGTINTVGTPDTQVEAAPPGVDFCLLVSRSKLGALLGFTFEVQFSSNLVDWETGTDPGTVVADNGEAEVVKVTYPLFLSNGRKARFWRVVLN